MLPDPCIQKQSSSFRRFTDSATTRPWVLTVRASKLCGEGTTKENPSVNMMSIEFAKVLLQTPCRWQRIRHPALAASITALPSSVSASSKSCLRAIATFPDHKIRHGNFLENHRYKVLPQSSYPQLYCWGFRFKNSLSKMGKHLETLDEMAHETVRQEARERRQKKKEKQAARKAKQKGDHQSVEHHAGEAVELAHHDSEDFDYDDDDDDGYEADDDETESDDSTLPDPETSRSKMLKIVDQFVESLKAIRGAEPSPEFFDDVVVEAYGANTPLKSVAQVVITSPTLATATCFDPSLSKMISVAIRNKLSLNPSVEDGGVIKIPLPRVSMESRQRTAAALKKRTENYRQRIRRVRRNALEAVKKGVAGKLEGVSKDDAFRVQKEIEAITDQVIHQLNEAADKKHATIMAV